MDCLLRTFWLSWFFTFIGFYRASICEGGHGSRNSVCLSVRPSVCLSHTWIVTKLNDALRIFWYHTKGQSLCYSDTIIVVIVSSPGSKDHKYWKRSSKPVRSDYVSGPGRRWVVMAKKLSLQKNCVWSLHDSDDGNNMLCCILPDRRNNIYSFRPKRHELTLLSLIHISEPTRPY